MISEKKVYLAIFVTLHAMARGETYWRNKKPRGFGGVVLFGVRRGLLMNYSVYRRAWCSGQKAYLGHGTRRVLLFSFSIEIPQSATPLAPALLLSI